MIRVLSAPMASASAACVRIDERSSAFSTTYPHMVTSCAASTGNSAAIMSLSSGDSIAARSRRGASDMSTC